MKSILQSIALLSAVILITSCDSSSGGGAANIGVPTPAPQVGVSGSAVKGVIDGATVTVTDADGDVIATSLTVNGNYDMVFDSTQVAAGVADPITVTVTSGTTLCDYDNPDDSGNDCPTGQPAPGDFVSFGEPYALDSTFVLRGIIAAQVGGADPTNKAFISPASEIAVQKAIEKAAGAALTTSLVLESNLAITGLIETLTGVDLGGADITQIATADLTATGANTNSDAALAIAAFASAVIGDQASNETLTAVIARFAAGVTVDADGNIATTGTALAALANAVAKGLTVANAKRPTAGLTAAVANAKANAVTFAALGNAAVKVSPPAPAGTNTPATQTRAFVQKLAAAVGKIAATTGANSFGGTNQSATEVFATELETVRLASSGNATKAFTKLDAALKAAATSLDAGSETTFTNPKETEQDDGIEFVMTKDANGFTISGVSSRWPIAATEGNSVTITSTAAANSSSTAVNLPGVKMVTNTGTTTIQTFEGSGTVKPNGTATNLDGAIDVTLNGTVTGATGDKFVLAATLTNLDDANGNDTGAYTLSFKFDASSAAVSDLTLAFNGDIGSNTQNFTITTSAGTITGKVVRNGDQDTDTLTDGTVTLTLNLVNAQVTADANGIIGTFSTGTGENKATSATLNNQGIVTYNDGSIQSLPAIIF